MPSRRPHHRRSAWSGAVPVAMIAAVAATMAAAAAPSAPDTRPPAAIVRTAAFAWSPAQVRQLIAAIEEARRHGLDPSAYGLAALRAELDMCEQLWNTPGSRQLDTLARISALALANEYRRRSAAAQVRPGELDAALGAGRVGPWLAAQAPAPTQGSIS